MNVFEQTLFTFSYLPSPNQQRRTTWQPNLHLLQHRRKENNIDSAVSIVVALKNKFLNFPPLPGINLRSNSTPHFQINRFNLLASLSRKEKTNGMHSLALSIFLRFGEFRLWSRCRFPEWRRRQNEIYSKRRITMKLCQKGFIPHSS